MSSITKRYTEQHQELLEIADQIKESLDIEALAKNAQEIRSLVSQLLGKLTVHLSMEDKVLYPRLLEHGDAKVRKTARRVQAEISDVADAMEGYRARWTSALAVQEDPRAFVEETSTLLRVLSERIRREDDELFPCLQKLD